MKEVITPSHASELLKNNICNRNPKKVHIKSLAHQMRNGQWLYNGEPIIIAKDGIILDGQHRLYAIIEANVSVEMEVIRGIENNVMHTIDSGVARTTADSLNLLGYDNSTGLAKTVRNLIQFRNKQTLRESRSRDQLISNKDIIDFIENEPPVIRVFADARTEHNFKKSNILTKSEIAVFWYIFKDIDEEKANIFFDKLLCGIDIKADDAVLHLRNKLIIDKTNKNTSMNYSTKLKLIFKAWNKFYNNEKCKLLKVTSDEDIIYPIEYPKYYK